MATTFSQTFESLDVDDPLLPDLTGITVSVLPDQEGLVLSFLSLER